MNVDTLTPLAGSEKPDSEIKHWAAEDFAVAIGLLRECPFHGQPYRVDRSALAGSKAIAANLPDARNALEAFDGDRRELLASAQRIARGYGQACAQCEAAAEQDLFD